MKSKLLLLAWVALQATTNGFSQQPPSPPPAPPIPLASPSPSVPQPPPLTRFSLDFPGGNPGQLVQAIESASGKRLNAIIPDQFADTKLPPLKMTGVTAAELFTALELATLKSEAVTTGSSAPYGPPSYQVAKTMSGFRTPGPGRPSDDAIWYFYVEKPALPPLTQARICRFWSLAPYLEQGTTVDDITTAVQTGWKMLGEKSTPDVSFHKDTKLLIAVGEPARLALVDDMLAALLTTVKSSGKPLPAPPTPKPATNR